MNMKMLLLLLFGQWILDLDDLFRKRSFRPQRDGDQDIIVSGQVGTAFGLGLGSGGMLAASWWHGRNMNKQVRSELFALQAWNSLLRNIISGAWSLWILPSGKHCLFGLIGCSLGLPVSAFDVFVHWDLTQELNAETHFVDGIPLTFSQSALDEVKWANVRTDLWGVLTPSCHFDDEKLQESSQKILDNLIEAEKYLKEDPPDAEDARDEFGTAVHTLQDFYAHSNWADIKTNSEDIHPDLGVRILLNPPSNRAFCNNSGALLPNLSGDITTGYFSLTCSSTPEGKCHHGYEGVGSLPPCPSRPGINKDTASRIVHDRAYSQVRYIS